MEVVFKTEKRFPDGRIEVVLKQGYLQSIRDKAKARKTRAFNEWERASKRERLNKELNTVPMWELRKRKLLELELNEVNIANWKRSARRARQALYDICKCNEFKYFGALTFDDEKVDRMDDKQVRRKFSQWANAVRKQFPNMFYVATPEYHKKGGLHFHLLIGGITMEDLKVVAAINKKGRLIFKRGKQIFNITAWKYGYSTLSVVENLEASKHYICKYITKQHYEPRFFGKRRYYCSTNVVRPEIVKEQCDITAWKYDLDVWQVAYFDEKKKYGIFRQDGNGQVILDLNTEGVRAIIERMTQGGARTSEARAPRVPYLTIGTLDSNISYVRTKEKFRELNAWINDRMVTQDLLTITDEEMQSLMDMGLIA